MCYGVRYDLGRPHGKPASFLRKHCGRPYNQIIKRGTDRYFWRFVKRPYRLGGGIYFVNSRMCGDDLSQGSLREGAPRSGGGDCEKNGSDLFIAELSNLFVYALSLTLVPRELLDVCLQTRQSLCDMSAGSLLVSLRCAKKSADGCTAITDIFGRVFHCLIYIIVPSTDGCVEITDISVWEPPPTAKLFIFHYSIFIIHSKNKRSPALTDGRSIDNFVQITQRR